MTKDRTTELRLALGMRGGVSLAIWIGGACGEIDLLRRATEEGHGSEPLAGEGTFWGELLAASRYERVVVDVMAGASAGGLNGVLFAAAIRNRFSMVGLRDVWVRLGATDRLLRTGEPWLSLFAGDERFLDEVHRELATRVRATAPEPSHPLDVQLSATLVEPLQIAAARADEEAQSRTRWSARFHFRHDPDSLLGRTDLAPTEAALWRLAVAARATSSYPVAFEGSLVRSTRPPAGVELGPLDATPGGRDVELGGVFSERRGERTNPGAPRDDDPPPLEDLRADDFVVSDGGIVDNIPLGKALDAVRAAPAGGPTRRVLLYLHPTGPSIPPPAAPPGPPPTRDDRRREAFRRRRTAAVVTGAAGTRLGGETITDDIAQIEAHNAAVAKGRALRRATFGVGAQHPAGLAVPTITEAAAAAYPNYRVLRASADAHDLFRLLNDPLGSLGADPFPRVGAADGGEGDDRWRAPLARTEWEGWRTGLEEALLQACRAASPPAWGIAEDGTSVAPGEQLLGSGLAPLRRALLLLLEVVRAVERVAPDPVLGTAKASAYRLLALVTEVAEPARRLGWVRLVGAAPDVPPTDDDGVLERWCADRIEHLDALLVVPPGGPSGDGAGARERARAHVATVWDACSVPLRPVVPPAGGVDLRDEVLRGVRDLLETPELQAALAEGDLTGAAADPLRAALVASDADVLDRLAALEVLCLPEELMGAPGMGEVEFRRVSAAAPTPLAGNFTHLKRWTDARAGGSHSPHHLAPAAKLAGNELASFSAFLRADWRRNDWLWGRLDAVPTLVDLILDGCDPEVVEPMVRRARATLGGASDDGAVAATDADMGLTDRAEARDVLVALRQRQILAAEWGVPLSALEERMATHRVGLETVQEPGDPDLQASLVSLAVTGTNVAEANLPGPAGGLVRALGRVARVGVWWWARPRGLPDDDEADDVRTVAPGREGGRAAGGWAGLGIGLALAVVAVAVAWGVASDRTAFLLGAVPVAVLFALLTGLVLALPARAPRRRRPVRWAWKAIRNAARRLVALSLGRRSDGSVDVEAPTGHR